MPVFLKKLLAWGSVAFLVYFMAFRPHGAANIVKSVGGGLMTLAQGLGDFLTSLMA